jgi:hypothetical protein
MVEKDLRKYFASISSELQVTKDRVRDLIGGAHWLTDGSHKEIILRSILKRHLPEELNVTTGFIYKNSEISSQVDILVLDRSGYTLFKEGELVITTPHAVRAVIEVKTGLGDPGRIRECVGKLAKNASLAERELVQNRGQVWCGLFVYDGDIRDAEILLKALAEADNSEGYPVTCVAYGPDLLVRFWSTGGRGPVWISHRCSSLATGWFIMDMVGSLTRNTGVSDFPVINLPLLNAGITPEWQIKRGETKVEALVAAR